MKLFPVVFCYGWQGWTFIEMLESHLGLRFFLCPLMVDSLHLLFISFIKGYACQKKSPKHYHVCCSPIAFLKSTG